MHKGCNESMLCEVHVHKGCNESMPRLRELHSMLP